MTSERYARLTKSVGSKVVWNAEEFRIAHTASASCMQERLAPEYLYLAQSCKSTARVSPTEELAAFVISVLFYFGGLFLATTTVLAGCYVYESFPIMVKPSSADTKPERRQTKLYSTVAVILAFVALSLAGQHYLWSKKEPAGFDNVIIERPRAIEYPFITTAKGQAIISLVCVAGIVAYVAFTTKPKKVKKVR